MEIQKISEQSEEQNRLSPDSKDFKIGDPVATLYFSEYESRVIFSYIDAFDWDSEKFHLDSGTWYSFDELRHPTSEELEKYFRK